MKTNCLIVFVVQVTFTLGFIHLSQAFPPAQILYDHLFNGQYRDRDVRPVTDPIKPVIMYMNLSLAQLLEVNEKDQQVVLNLWVMQEWKDESFRWNPDDYGGVKMLYIPSGDVWVPDLVLYNNAGGTWDLGSASNSKVKVWYDGTMQWKPPIIFYAQCDIDVEYFPFDVQTCTLKMGTWTHNGFLIDLRHSTQKPHDEGRQDSFDNCESTINYAIDLAEYVSNGEWDLLDVSGRRNIDFYPCCPEPYIDIKFFITLRRKTLFYGTNLISPCISFALLVPLLFYLPSGSGEKITMCVSIFLIVLVFLVVLFDLTPATSLVVPLMAKYLLFTMLSTAASIVASTIVLNIHLRMPDSNKIPNWARVIFLIWLPKLLFVERPKPIESTIIYNFPNKCHTYNHTLDEKDSTWLQWQNKQHAQSLDSTIQLTKAIENVKELSRMLFDDEKAKNESSDWQFIAFVIDRVLLVIFSLSLLFFSGFLFMTAPSIFDNRGALTSDMAADLLARVNYTRLCG